MRQKIQLILLVLVMVFAPVSVAMAAPAIARPTLTPLQDQVRHALVMLPYYGVFDNLQFQVEGSKVILSGQVVRPTLKGEAEKAVERLPGVTAVENKIEILPLSPMDSRIRLATYRAIYRNVNFTRYAIQPVPPIHIIVKNGRVTLVGVVGSKGDKAIANISARSVPGVFSVVDDLRVA